MIPWLVVVAHAGPVEGGALFEREWRPHDEASPAGDGLGPLYNETSCAGCHRQGGVGGAGGLEANVTLLLAEGVVPRSSTSRRWAAYREGLFTPPDELPDFGCGTAANMFMRQFEPSFRQTSALFGAGALDAVTEADLERAVLAGEAAGVSGRIARDAEGRPGRFGWKAQTASLATFVDAACATELGLTTPTTAQAVDPTLPLDLAPPAPGIDLDAGQVADLVAFVASLSPPAVAPSDAADRGRAAFGAVGCDACHVERLGPVEGAFTDLLLHDLGHGLSDGSSSYGGSENALAAAVATEWRTPPLWGVAASPPYLHDGRAPTLDEAIRAHGGEAEAVTLAYTALEDPLRLDLLAFLGSLGGPEGS